MIHLLQNQKKKKREAHWLKMLLTVFFNTTLADPDQPQL